jgi:uncharacterized UPF0160 family protein
MMTVTSPSDFVKTGSQPRSSTLVGTPAYAQAVRIATHSGNFHADDVFAVATLLLLLEKDGHDVEIVRTRDAAIIDTADYVVDVGGKNDPNDNQFDHHQQGGAGERADGIPYAAFGLVWKKYGEKVAGSRRIAQDIDEKLVQTIDAMDNGVDIFSGNQHMYRYLIHDLVFSFKPSWKEKNRSFDESFAEVVTFAKRLLEREIVLARDNEEGEAHVLEAYYNADDKRLLVLDDEYPWQQVLVNYPEVLYVVSPDDDGRGNWKVRAVRDSVLGFENRKDLPVAWAGLRGKDLQKITGVEDAQFCHNKRFIAIAGSKEGALELARQALEAVPVKGE